MSAVIADGGGKVAQTEYWGLKSLAYRIKKNRKGHYTMMTLDAPALAVKEFERNLRLNEDVLRLMTIRVEKLNDEPSVMMKNKNSRDERGHRDDQTAEKGDDETADETDKVETQLVNGTEQATDQNAKQANVAATNKAETPLAGEAEVAEQQNTGEEK
jgi:small subunit ribosomal protein S6